MLKKTAITFLLALTLSACATQGKKIDDQTISHVKKGYTTEQQVIAMMGKPTSITMNSNGTKQLIYTYSHANMNAASYIPFVNMFMSGVNSESQVFYITINKKGKVSDYTISNSASKTNTGLL